MGCTMGKVSMRLVMLGLDGAGKTTILYKMLGSAQELVVSTKPTVGFNVEEVDYMGIRLTMWDLGGQAKIRALWCHYLKDIEGLIYVVDSSDKERLREAREELRRIVTHPDCSTCKVVLVMANKDDVTNRMSADEVRVRLGLPQQTSSSSGSGTAPESEASSSQGTLSQAGAVSATQVSVSLSPSDSDVAAAAAATTLHGTRAGYDGASEASSVYTATTDDATPVRWPPIRYHVQECCALSGKGLDEGIQVLLSLRRGGGGGATAAAAGAAGAGGGVATAVTTPLGRA